MNGTTLHSHCRGPGSIPGRSTVIAGRAPHSHCGDPEFESSRVHPFVASLLRASKLQLTTSLKLHYSGSMPQKRRNLLTLPLRRARKKHAYTSRRVRSWQLIFVLFLVLAIPLFVFVLLQTSRAKQVLGTKTQQVDLTPTLSLQDRETKEK